jgi:hypothetical protein
MSATTPTPAIVKAQTPADIAAAMLNDPGLQSAIMGLLDGDKSLLQSKTFWAAIITPSVATLVAHFALGLDAGTVGMIDTGLEMLAMIVMRAITAKPITGIVSPASKS